MTKVLKTTEFIAEGAGSGYSVTFKGLEFDLEHAKFNGISTKSDNGDEYWQVSIPILPCTLGEWETNDYYRGITSNGDERAFFYDGEDLRVDGGSSVWEVSKNDFLDYVREKYSEEIDEKLNVQPVTKSRLGGGKDSLRYNKCLLRFFKDNCDTVMDEFKFNYGGGWSHSNLSNPINLDGNKHGNYGSLAELSDYYSNVVFNCISASINCKTIVEDINGFYAYDDYEDGE